MDVVVGCVEAVDTYPTVVDVSSVVDGEIVGDRESCTPDRRLSDPLSYDG